MRGAGHVGGLLRAALQLRQDGPDHVEVLKMLRDREVEQELSLRVRA